MLCFSVSNEDITVNVSRLFFTVSERSLKIHHNVCKQKVVDLFISVYDQNSVT